MNEWMNEWMNGWMDGWMNEWIKWVNTLWNDWIELNESMKDWMNKKKNEYDYVHMKRWMTKKKFKIKVLPKTLADHTP